MFDDIQWLFFDVGSTIVNEQKAYEHRFNDIAHAAHTSFEDVYNTAIAFYKLNKKGDLEAAKKFSVPMPQWHTEDELLYDDAIPCFANVSRKFHIGIIANQSLGTEERLQQFGILNYIDIVIASAEEGVAKPDRRIFEIALERSNCEPANAIMIGDRIDNDVIPAKQIGMKTIWIKQGFGQYWQITKGDEKPDYTVNNLTELCNLLLNS